MTTSQEYAHLLEPLLRPAAAYARSILRNTHDAQEAVQQAALRGLQRISTFDADRPFRGWWFALLRNCCIDVLRERKAAKAQSLGDFAISDLPAADSSRWTDLANAMDELSDDHREILRLKYFSELTYGEMAEALRIPQGTVMSRLHLARRALRARMLQED